MIALMIALLVQMGGVQTEAMRGKWQCDTSGCLPPHHIRIERGGSCVEFMMPERTYALVCDGVKEESK